MRGCEEDCEKVRNRQMQSSCWTGFALVEEHLRSWQSKDVTVAGLLRICSLFGRLSRGS